MKAEFPDFSQLLCFDVYSVNQAFNQAYKSLLEPLGLTYPQYLVLLILWEEDHQTVSGIGKQVGLESSTLTPLIKRLETNQLLVRKRDREDERRVIVSLTEKGKGLKQRASSIPECIAEATGMTLKEIVALQTKLKDLKSALLSSAE